MFTVLCLKRKDKTLTSVLSKADLHFRREKGLLPVGWLLVGVDAGVPLHRAILFAGLGSFCGRRAHRCCHAGSCARSRWISAVLEGSL